MRGSRRDVRLAIKKAIAIAAGAAGGDKEASEGVQIRVGLAALANIKEAFIEKSKGGTDAAGLKWPPLSPKTVAYSRRHPGVPKNRSGFRPSWMLSDKQRKRWWELYRQGLARYRGDQAAAARLAWSIVKGEGAKTLIGEYGNTPVMILRDTGLLLNSLSPGVVSSSHPTIQDVENQVFIVGPGSVIVGTNRKHAASHHYGVPGRIPQRRLWPEPDQWPDEWWQDIAAAGREGMIEILLSVLRQS